MKTLSVPGMHCERCVERITKALEAQGLNFEVSLKSKTVGIDGCENCVKTAINTLDELGFEAEQQ
ncbi:MAG: heavy-metal-associated domain-containing protein [Clostridiales bacterium]|nr:heavy-metal-associated domain-containing protein [Clostridiales bacterium]